jgi:predicted O-methyltransferase YrrM
MKNLLKRLIGHFGYELCKLSPEELLSLDEHLDVNYKEAQIYRALTASGQISLEEGRYLFELVKESDPNRPIVEVGTLYGASTLVMCLAKHPSQTLYAVDNFSWNSLGISSSVHRAATRKRLAECIEHFGVKLVEQPAEAFYANYADAPPALYFCDADHTYEAVKKDIAWAKAQQSTIICGDDYEPHHTGVVRAVDEAGGPAALRGGLWRL